MWKRLSILVFSLFAAGSLHADDSLLKIESLYQSDGLVPGELLPLRVSGTVPAAGKLRSVIARPVGSKDCRVMRDPYRTDIFLLKCSAAAQLSVEFSFELNGDIYRRTIAGLEVKVPNPNFVIDDTKPPGDELNGQQLYSTHCLSCHNPPASKGGRPATAISNAIQNNSQMRVIPTLTALTSAEIIAIAKYLGTQ